MIAHVAEGWPLYLALVGLAGLTYGALRPYIKRGALPPNPKDTRND